MSHSDSKDSKMEKEGAFKTDFRKQNASVQLNQPFLQVTHNKL